MMKVSYIIIMAWHQLVTLLGLFLSRKSVHTFGWDRRQAFQILRANELYLGDPGAFLLAGTTPEIDWLPWDNNREQQQKKRDKDRSHLASGSHTRDLEGEKVRTEERRTAHCCEKRTCSCCTVPCLTDNRIYSTSYYDNTTPLPVSPNKEAWLMDQIQCRIAVWKPKKGIRTK